MKDTIYFNGDILTMEKNMYVEAIYIKDGIIKKVGSKEEILKLKNKETNIIDLKGKTLMPSFIDSHSHFFGYANSKLQVNLEEAVNFNEINEKIKSFIENNNIKQDTWILCNNFDYNSLEEKTYPRIEFLDKISPKNPLVISNKSGHNGLFNSLAMKKLGINESIKNPEGGVFHRENGKLNGYAEENAYINYIQKVPMPSLENIIKAIKKAQNSYASYGITTVQEGMIVSSLVGFLTYIIDLNILKVDYIGYVDIKEKDTILSKLKDYIKKYKNHFKVGGYKAFLDGSPQGRTAYMRSDYVGESGYRAYPVINNNETKKLMKIALEDNMQILVHCNGDAAVEMFIKQYKEAKKEINTKNDIRPVIVHAQLIGKDQLEEVKELGMIPSFFEAHVYYFGDVHIKNFGYERASQISPAKAALEKGLKFTLHQDSPVIEPNIIETIWIAVNREMKNGEVLGDGEKIPVVEALKAVTINAAYQYMEENLKGSIKEGKLADLVILDNNPLKVQLKDINKIKVVETIKEGNTIYKSK